MLSEIFSFHSRSITCNADLFQVIAVAVIATFLFKKDSDISEYEQRLGKMSEGIDRPAKGMLPN